MCGRYYFKDKTAHEIEEDLGLDMGSLFPAGDITPGTSPVVFAAIKGDIAKEIRIANMFWGISGKDKKLVINARAETALEKPMFSEAIANRRIVIPAAGFYEWDKDKNKVTFSRKDERPIYLAGFYQLSENKDSFVILTTAANESMIKVHDRMPLMIEDKAVRDWLYDRNVAKELLGMKMPLLESKQEYQQMKLFE